MKQPRLSPRFGCISCCCYARCQTKLKSRKSNQFSLCLSQLCWLHCPPARLARACLLADSAGKAVSAISDQSKSRPDSPPPSRPHCYHHLPSPPENLSPPTNSAARLIHTKAHFFFSLRPRRNLACTAGCDNTALHNHPRLPPLDTVESLDAKLAGICSGGTLSST